MRIDAHVHLQDIEQDMNVQINALQSQYNKLRIEKALLIPSDHTQRNEDVATIRNKFNKLFDLVCLIDFGSTDFSSLEGQMEYYLDTLKCVGFKIHPRYQGISLTDKRIITAVQIAGKMRLPVIIDCLPSRGQIRIMDMLPLLVDEIAMSCPKTPIIMSHMGGHRVLDALIVAIKNPNVFMDVSAVMIKYHGSTIMEDIAYCIAQLVDTGKILFGSDYPAFSPCATYKLLKKIAKKKHLKHYQMENIMGQNLMKIMEKRK